MQQKNLNFGLKCSPAVQNIMFECFYDFGGGGHWIGGNWDGWHWGWGYWGCGEC